MRYFLDTEFNEDGKLVELISYGLVAQDGREFYRISTDFDPNACNDWVKEHVLPALPPRSDYRWMPKRGIAIELLSFVGVDPDAEFWGYFADYDWVVNCQLFGSMVNLPKNFPKFCMDLKQLMVHLGVTKQLLPKQTGTVHDAVEDARWNKQVFEFLTEHYAKNPTGFMLSRNHLAIKL